MYLYVLLNKHLIVIIINHHYYHNHQHIISDLELY